MLYKIWAALHPIPIFKGTLFNKISSSKNHNGNALGSQLLQIRGSLRLIDLKTCLPEGMYLIKNFRCPTQATRGASNSLILGREEKRKTFAFWRMYGALCVVKVFFGILWINLQSFELFWKIWNCLVGLVLEQLESFGILWFSYFLSSQNPLESFGRPSTWVVRNLCNPLAGLGIKQLDCFWVLGVP